MKAIPKELRTYFPKAVDAARPWWVSVEDERDCTQRRTSDGDGMYSCYTSNNREFNDKRDPLPPPPILVGQVWALQVPSSPLRVGAVTHTWQDAIVTVGISGFGMNLRGDLLLESGFLLACPFGYAPWSGPEVP